jgi:hypothetical protein
VLDAVSANEQREDCGLRCSQQAFSTTNKCRQDTPHYSFLAVFGGTPGNPWIGRAPLVLFGAAIRRRFHAHSRRCAARLCDLRHPHRPSLWFSSQSTALETKDNGNHTIFLGGSRYGVGKR